MSGDNPITGITETRKVLHHTGEYLSPGMTSGSLTCSSNPVYAGFLSGRKWAGLPADGRGFSAVTARFPPTVIARRKTSINLINLYDGGSIVVGEILLKISKC